MSKLELREGRHWLDGRAVDVGATVELLLSGGRWLRCQYRWNGEESTQPVFSLVLGGVWERRTLSRPRAIEAAPEAIVRLELEDGEFRWPIQN